MLGLRLAMEAQPRWKKGQPPQSTTGVESTSSIHVMARVVSRWSKKWPPIMCDMPSRNTGRVKTRLAQKRRLIEASSGFACSCAVTVRGSDAIPQIGQEPGSERTISGCIGQTYSVRLAGKRGIGSSAMPHFGQGPGSAFSTSGSIGQV